ncbi:uncharacterized protein LOC109717624 [Ananas comosus]|uniref:Uncharacterized protein LOC109717624 n=1 Tax=Ananas comosus TaxID=4615 RepID=A0A6P5FTT5_ANACO|nr:uncharacterized protein LOC109717624 [Ananas comosus]XP_020099073.1 uncharacterized protein LOC109717624 [Ananas comosus]
MATVNVGTLIRSVAAPPPPPPRAAAHSVPTAPRRLFLLLCSATAAAPFITSASSSSSVAAISLGIPGPKEWLREQKKKAAKYVLAPIDASRQTLRNAYQLLEAAPDSAAEKTKEVRSLLYSAARDCVPEQRNSLVAFQSQTGVEV